MEAIENITLRNSISKLLEPHPNPKEMEIVAKNSPLINKFIIKKTSQFYKILS